MILCPGVGSHLVLALDAGHYWTITDAAPGFVFHGLVAGAIASHPEPVDLAAPRAAPSE